MRVALLASVIACSSTVTHAPADGPASDASQPGPCGLPFQPYVPPGCASHGLAALAFGSGTWQLTGIEHLGQGSAAFAIDVTTGSDGCAQITGAAPAMTPMPSRWYVDDSVAMAQDGGSAKADLHFWYLCADGSGAGSAYGATKHVDPESGQYVIATYFIGTFSR